MDRPAVRVAVWRPLISGECVTDLNLDFDGSDLSDRKSHLRPDRNSVDRLDEIVCLLSADSDDGVLDEDVAWGWGRWRRRGWDLDQHLVHLIPANAGVQDGDRTCHLGQEHTRLARGGLLSPVPTAVYLLRRI